MSSDELRTAIARLRSVRQAALARLDTAEEVQEAAPDNDAPGHEELVQLERGSVRELGKALEACRRVLENERRRPEVRARQ